MLSSNMVVNEQSDSHTVRLQHSVPPRCRLRWVRE